MKTGDVEFVCPFFSISKVFSVELLFDSLGAPSRFGEASYLLCRKEACQS